MLPSDPNSSATGGALPRTKYRNDPFSCSVLERFINPYIDDLCQLRMVNGHNAQYQHFLAHISADFSALQDRSLMHVDRMLRYIAVKRTAPVMLCSVRGCVSRTDGPCDATGAPAIEH